MNIIRLWPPDKKPTIKKELILERRSRMAEARKKQNEWQAAAVALKVSDQAAGDVAIEMQSIPHPSGMR